MNYSSLKYFIFSIVVLFVFCGTSYAETTIAIGDVDTGYSMNAGQKDYRVKETIQLGLKKEIERIGKDQFNVVVSSPAVVTDSGIEADSMPVLPTDRAPTQREMQEYMAAMQKYQKQLSGEAKVHKPVQADAYFEFIVTSSEGSTDTSGTASTLSGITGVDLGLGSFSSKSTRLYLTCEKRDPTTGALQDRYRAKASSVKFSNVGGYSSYNYGNDPAEQERLFNKAIKQCAKWIVGQVK